MLLRKYVATMATGSLAASALAMALASPAQADPTTTPVAGDVVGAGSDTSQFALDYLADGHGGVPGYNAGKAAGERLVGFHATGGGTVVLRRGAEPITRPNGSGGGKGLLHGAGDDADLTFARSSSGLSEAEINAGLHNFPFAVDTLAMAVSKSSNAPASLTAAQLVAIYKGEVTNWNQVGGSAGVIKPLIPQSGSGTRSFFLGELQKANDGVALTPASSWVEVQEHDDTDVKSDANAIAPFSAGRARIAGTVDLTGGFEAKRALYNVVRAADVDDAKIQDIFGEDGFVCSDDATALIEAAGFDQMAGPDAGGVCGEAMNANTTNFTIVGGDEGPAVTVTSLVAAVSANAVTLTATVTAGVPGEVEFFEGTASLAKVRVTAGTASTTLTAVSAGAHGYTAVFTPDDTEAHASSTGNATVTVAVPGKTQPCVAAEAALATAEGKAGTTKNRQAKAKTQQKKVNQKFKKAKKAVKKAKKLKKPAVAKKQQAKVKQLKKRLNQKIKPRTKAANVAAKAAAADVVKAKSVVTTACK